MYYVNGQGIFTIDFDRYDRVESNYIVNVDSPNADKQLDRFIEIVSDAAVKDYQKKLKNQFRELKGLLND